MESFHTHRSFASVETRLSRGFTTTKRVRQESNSDYSLANGCREKACLGKLTKRVERQMRVFTYLSEASAGRKPVRGFTLVELLVVLAIIIVIMGVVLSSQNSFNKTLILANTAYDVALSLRDAETFGLGSRVTMSGASNVGYGLHFQKSTPGIFTLFSDTNSARGSADNCHPVADSSSPNARPGNCVYDAALSEKVLDYTLGNGITVTNMCAFSSGAWSCSSGSVTSLDIVFSRPDSNPFMSMNGTYSSSFPVTAACLTVSSPQGGSRFIKVEISGSITANAISCP